MMTNLSNITEKFGAYRQSALYGIIFTGIIIIFLVAVILPYSHSVKSLDEEIAKLKDQLSAQELQAPLYTSLVRQIKNKNIDGISLGEEEKLSRNDISQISLILKDLAERSNLVHTKSHPDINSMDKTEGLLSVDVVIEGSLFDFRNFIVSLNEIPYLQDIEKLSVSTVNINRIFKLKIWLAIE